MPIFSQFDAGVRLVDGPGNGKECEINVNERGASNKKQSTSAKVSLGASDGTLFISFLLTNCNYLVSILALSN